MRDARREWVGLGVRGLAGERRSGCLIEFQTNKNGTFAPSITKSGNAATWIIDGVAYSTNTPSVALSGDTVDVRLILDDPLTVTQLIATNQGVLGIPDITRLSNIQIIRLEGNSGLTGNISELYENTSLLRIYLGGTLAAASLTGIDALTNLVYVYLYNLSNLTGDVETLNESKFSYIHVSQTGITGDLANCDNWTNLVTLSAFGTALAYGGGGAAQSWTAGKTLEFQNNNWAQAEVSALVGDIYTMRDSWVAGAKTLNIGGTNAAPDATALSQIVTLEASYNWTITHTAP